MLSLDLGKEVAVHLNRVPGGGLIPATAVPMQRGRTEGFAITVEPGASTRPWLPGQPSAPAVPVSG